MIIKYVLKHTFCNNVQYVTQCKIILTLFSIILDLRLLESISFREYFSPS